MGWDMIPRDLYRIDKEASQKRNKRYLRELLDQGVINEIQYKHRKSYGWLGVLWDGILEIQDPVKTNNSELYTPGNVYNPYAFSYKVAGKELRYIANKLDQMLDAETWDNNDPIWQWYTGQFGISIYDGTFSEEANNAMFMVFVHSVLRQVSSMEQQKEYDQNMLVMERGKEKMALKRLEEAQKEAELAKSSWLKATPNQQASLEKEYKLSVQKVQALQQELEALRSKNEAAANERFSPEDRKKEQEKEAAELAAFSRRHDQVQQWDLDEKIKGIGLSREERFRQEHPEMFINPDTPKQFQQPQQVDQATEKKKFDTMSFFSKGLFGRKKQSQTQPTPQPVQNKPQETQSQPKQTHIEPSGGTKIVYDKETGRIKAVRI